MFSCFSVASSFGGMEVWGAFVADDVCGICWVAGFRLLCEFNETLRRSCLLHSLWNVIEFFVGKMDLRIFIASLKLSLNDLSGEHELPVGLSIR